MNTSPVMVRIMPMILYLVPLFIASFTARASLWSVPIIYGIACVLITWFLWRYRKQLPEMNLRWHWTVIPSAVFLTVAWIGLGWLMTQEFGARLDALLGWWNDQEMDGQSVQPIGMFDYREGSYAEGMEPNRFAMTERHEIQDMQEESQALFLLSMGLRFWGMCLLVPLFEEVFSRSLCLRAFNKPRTTAIGLAQMGEDLPLIGDRIYESKLAKEGRELDNQLVAQLINTPLGHVTLFATFCSTLIFTANHLPRDYAGCIACGIVWCTMVWWTNRDALAPSETNPKDRRLGLGPVVWSHALVNAWLWGYCWWSGDWQFL